MNAEKVKMIEAELREKEYQLSFQKMVLDIAFDFMLVHHKNFDQKVNSLLAKLGQFVDGDRTYLFRVLDDQQLIYSHEWCSQEAGKRVESVKDRQIDLTKFNWWQKQLETQPTVYYIENVDQMPDEADQERAHLKELTIQSTISVPIIIGAEIYGFIGIDSIHSIKKWSAADTQLLQALAKIIASGVRQINSANKIQHMAYHDQLTGLPNARLLEKHIAKAIQQAETDQSLVSVLFIDLDEFKKINDSVGHREGDELLKELATRLVSIVNEEDVVSRRGGDEFIILLKNYQDENKLDQILTKIIEAFKQPFDLNQQRKYITGSIGVSRYPADGVDAKELIKYADIAMYHAKNLGKNQYQKMTPQLKENTEKTISLTNDLYQAVEKDELEVFYQPIVKSQTTEIVGLEALLRWKHPVYGYVSPGEFIPLAERTGLINPIGSWVTETVSQQIYEWNQKGYQKLCMAVNFSVHELNQPDMQEQLKSLIAKYSLDPQYLEIEITESLGLDYLSPTVPKLNEIEELGITLTIDDYGQGYSSLSRLKDLDIGKIKIDRLFIQGIGTSIKDEMIIKGLISFAESLHLTVVAEGVETKMQADFLKQFENIQMQGYYFYRPQTAKEIENLLIIHH